MNKFMMAVVLILSVAVVLLSGAVFYFSQCKCQGQFSPGFNPGNRISPEQDRPMPGNMLPIPNAEGQLEIAPPSGQPNLPGGPNMGGGQRRQRPQGGPGLGGGRQGMGQQGGPGMSGEQGQGQTGSREQISKIMQEAMQEAQSYFMSQNRKPEHQEMLNKVKELMIQKMNAQGISRDIQQKVFSGMDQASPPQSPQQRQ